MTSGGDAPDNQHAVDLSSIPPPPGYTAAPVPYPQVPMHALQARPLPPAPTLDFTPELTRVRWSTLVRGFLVWLPLLWAFVLTIAAVFVICIGNVAAIFTGQLPTWCATFLEGWVAYWTRVVAFGTFVTDDIPSFRASVETRSTLRMTFPRTQQNRWHVFFRGWSSVPVLALWGLVALGALVFTIPTWLLSVILGRTPKALYGFNAAVVRYGFRVSAYSALLTSRWPTGLFGDKVAKPLVYPGGPLPPVQPRSLFTLSGGSKALIILAMLTSVLGSIGAIGVAGAPYITAGAIESAYETLSDEATSFVSRAQTYCSGDDAYESCIDHTARALRDDTVVLSFVSNHLFGFDDQREQLGRTARRLKLQLDDLLSLGGSDRVGSRVEEIINTLSDLERDYGSYEDVVNDDIDA